MPDASTMDPSAVLQRVDENSGRLDEMLDKFAMAAVQNWISGQAPNISLQQARARQILKVHYGFLEHQLRTALADTRRVELQPIATAQKNATDVLLLVKWKGDIRHRWCIAHWAEDLSGSDQPPFQGWFYKSGPDRYSEIVASEILGWAPLPPTHAAMAATPREET